MNKSPLYRGCLKTIKLPKYKLTVIGKKLEIARITQPPTPNPEPRCLSIQTASCKEGLREVSFIQRYIKSPLPPFTKGGHLKTLLCKEGLREVSNPINKLET